MAAVRLRLPWAVASIRRAGLAPPAGGGALHQGWLAPVGGRLPTPSAWRRAACWGAADVGHLVGLGGRAADLGPDSCFLPLLSATIPPPGERVRRSGARGPQGRVDPWWLVGVRVNLPIIRSGSVDWLEHPLHQPASISSLERIGHAGDRPLRVIAPLFTMAAAFHRLFRLAGAAAHAGGDPGQGAQDPDAPPRDDAAADLDQRLREDGAAGGRAFGSRNVFKTGSRIGHIGRGTKRTGGPARGPGTVHGLVNDTGWRMSDFLRVWGGYAPVRLRGQLCSWRPSLLAWPGITHLAAPVRQHRATLDRLERAPPPPPGCGACATTCSAPARLAHRPSQSPVTELCLIR